ncbi:MAG: PDZ domain-containing protein [Acidobacteriota bacterium]|nr:PDZ domain-containing protein [Acidobacteriota bacterium]
MNRSSHPARRANRLAEAARIGRAPVERAKRSPSVSRLAIFVLAALGLVLSAHSQRSTPAGPKLSFAHGGNAAEVPMELASNAIFVPVRIGEGRSLSWLLDAASPGTAAEAAIFAQSSAGQAANTPVLALPGLEIRETALETRSFDSLGPWYGQRVSGIVGDDVLDHLVVQLDYARRSIELYDPAAYTEPHHAEKLPIQWVDGLPAVRAQLRFGGRTVEGDFALNTGGNAAVAVSPQFLAAQRMYPYRGRTIPGTVFSASGDEAVAFVPGEWLQLGHSRILAPPVAIESAASTPFGPGVRKRNKKDALAGWIGGAILSKFELVLDFPKNRILLAPNRNFVLPIETDASGATITAAGPALDRFEVHAVSPGSPAAEAGLEPGDQIAWVDSDPASNLTLDQIREILSSPGHSPVLVVRRFGKEQKIALHLRPLF